MTSGATVRRVVADSLAEAAGVEPGDRLAAVNGRVPRDVIDYRYLIADERVRLRVRGKHGERTITLDKHPDRDLGIEFECDLFEGVRTCSNRCVFCFIKMLPQGLRPGLYLHDDDYRLSFLHGNFITLTNLTEADMRRIVRQHLSPLYVSVHATDPALRRRMFGVERLPDVMKQMRRLTTGGITLHTQIVICPGYNDGAALDRTVADVAALHPGVASIGVVPVGLTRFARKLDPVTPALARSLLDRAEAWQDGFRRRLGTRLLFAADELYLLAGRAFPRAGEYERYPQLENGIGIARRFIDRMHHLRLPAAVRPQRRATVVTGTLAAPLLARLARKLSGVRGLEVDVAPVQNRLFGPSVTVAGLLSGADIRSALRRIDPGDLVLVPAAAVRDGVFLDDMTVEELSAAVGPPVVAASTPAEALRACTEQP